MTAITVSFSLERSGVEQGKGVRGPLEESKAGKDPQHQAGAEDP